MRAQDGTRAVFQNINQPLKTYVIVGGVDRERIDDFYQITKIISVVAAFCNSNLNNHILFVDKQNDKMIRL